MSTWQNYLLFLIVILMSAVASWSAFPRCFRSQRPDQSNCREILNITHTFAQLLETEHPIDNNDVEGIMSLSSTFNPPISAECVDMALHLICIIGLPPCGPESGLPVLICEDHCTLFQQIQEAGLCDEIERRLALIQQLSNSQTFLAVVNAFEQLQCTDPSTYFFLNVTHPEPSHCSDIFSPDIERIFKSQLCELGIGPNCSRITESCKNCSSNASPGGSILLTAILPPVVIVVLAAFLAITLFLICCYHTHRKREEKLEKNSKEADMTFSATITYELGYDKSVTHEETRKATLCNEHYKAKLNQIAIPYCSLVMGEVIGQGAFGKVFEGRLSSSDNLKERKVAVKTIKNVLDADLDSFLSEGVVMKDFSHPNVLGLVGVVFDTPDGTPHLVLPFMENGNLKNFLKSKRGRSSKALKLSDFVKMCIDIAQGMKYLAENSFVHRDLAARNCMLDKDLQVKVGDFGLSRDIYTTDYYRISNKSAKLPAKWMPPETFNDGISNEKTDIWAYGVTCWEVFSLGRTPYPTVPNSEIFAYISHEGRLEKPDLCPEEIFDAMSQCWEQKPERRPNFAKITQFLVEYWDDRYGYI